MAMNFLEEAKKIKDGAKTIAEWLNGGAETVSRSDAQRRADTCLGCPMHVDGYKVTGAIAEAIKKQIELKNHLQLRVSGEKQIRFCNGCGCYLRLKIWLPIDKLGLDAVELQNFDPRCWMRKEFSENQKQTT